MTLLIPLAWLAIVVTVYACFQHGGRCHECNQWCLDSHECDNNQQKKGTDYEKTRI